MQHETFQINVRSYVLPLVNFHCNYFSKEHPSVWPDWANYYTTYIRHVTRQRPLLVSHYIELAFAKAALITWCDVRYRKLIFLCSMYPLIDCILLEL